MVRNSKEDVAAPMLFFTKEVADKMEKIKVTVLDINLFFLACYIVHKECRILSESLY